MKPFVIITLVTLALYGANDLPTPSLIIKNTNYVPGLGDIMGTIQMRHAKLWFAGKMKNWELAAYELDEIKEGLDDTVKYHPNFKNKPITKMIDSNTLQPISQIEQAIKNKNSKEFVKSFDKLSDACTSCHQSSGYGFISIKRPTHSPISNQKF